MKINIGSWGVKLSAFVLAVLLWFHAVTEDVYKQEIDIRLQVDDPPAKPSSPEELVVSNQWRSHVRVLASGQGKAFLRLKANDYVLRVQPSESTVLGKHIQSLRRDQVEKLKGPNIQIVEIIEPPEIEIHIDKKARRKVPVEPAIDLRIAPYFTQVGSIRLQPDSVVISGPSKQVRKVRSISTALFTKDNVREDVEGRSVDLIMPEGMRLLLSPSFINVSADIQELAEYPIDNVPVTVINSGRKNIVAEPSRVQVKVKGGADVLNSLDPEQDFTLYVNYRQWRGEEISVYSVPDSLFEVLEIIPDKVRLKER